MRRNNMAIRTTVNINRQLLENLSDASDRCRITKSHLAIILIKRLLRITGKRKAEKMLQFASQVKYQERDNDKRNWRKLHIRYIPGDYEYSIDSRKISKMSVSFLLAEAIRKYLHKVVRIILRDKNGDSYPDSNYMLGFEIIDGIACWILYWGIPAWVTGG